MGGLINIQRYYGWLDKYYGWLDKYSWFFYKDIMGGLINISTASTPN
jgi:hypothetical protein